MSKQISIIAPCFNERDNIQVFYEKIKNIFEKKLKDYDYELIVVDDYSKDGSTEILEKIAEIDNKFKVIFNSRNYGVHISTFNAIKYAKGML